MSVKHFYYYSDNLKILKNAHKENAVQDTLINRSYFVSRYRMVHTTFSIAVIIAAIPNDAHMSCPPWILNWVF